MPILYETYAHPKRRTRRLAVVRYPIPWPATIGCGKNLQKLLLPKPSEGTIVHTVNFAATGDLVTSGSPLTPVTAEVVFLVNGHPVASQGWWLCLIPRCTAPFNLYTNIGAIVTFDKYNEFVAEVRQSWSPFGCVTGVENLSAFVEYEYTGEPPPEPKPPPPEWWGYVKWGMVGVGAIVGIGVVLPKVIESVRKPKE